MIFSLDVIGHCNYFVFLSFIILDRKALYRVCKITGNTCQNKEHRKDCEDSKKVHLMCFSKSVNDISSPFPLKYLVFTPMVIPLFLVHD